MPFVEVLPLPPQPELFPYAKKLYSTISSFTLVYILYWVWGNYFRKLNKM